MDSEKIRKKFLKYFEKKDHSIVSSSSLVPEDDPTLLFTNAGMNQFKNLFLGLENRDYARATSSQKCVRAGGKHNDLENVGHTARHHTFFEMLGNFSFGDYFKKEAIHYAWDFITKEMDLDKKRLYVTVFKDDDEAAEIWHKQEGVPKDRIHRFGEKDNFWRMGDTGPCGPCSEIFYDFGKDVGGDPKQNVMGGEGDRFVEIWNLVFMQYNEASNGQMTPLPKPSVDTGMGLERLTTVIQGKINNYHTDLFQDIIGKAEKISGYKYVENIKKLKAKDLEKQNDINIAMSVLSDHARAAAFLISDGVLPSNDGRGYVLRRIMRRAIRYGRSLTDNDIYPEMVNAVIKKMEEAYPSLKKQQKLISSTVVDEQERFLVCLDKGTEILTDELNRLDNKGLKVVSGETVFKLYDTFGFPVDLTRIMANEKGFEVSENEFEERMQAAREKAKSSWKAKSISSDAQHIIKLAQDSLKKNGATQFTGYQGHVHDEATLKLMSNGKKTVDELKNGDSGLMILDQTCFYAEGGGQVGDSGMIRGPHGQAEVLDCTKSSDVHIHHIKVTDGSFKVGESCSLNVDEVARRNTTANHSATHLMHAALKKVLGEHVNQAGSLVTADRTRFDFTHNKPISAEELSRIEELVNFEISHSHQVSKKLMSHPEAIEDGALALFGEKYGDEVRVVGMGDFSKELCGGTHVENTAMIRLFKIVAETGVSSGVRRIEAITGDLATKYVLKHTQENIQVREVAGLQENWTQFLEESKGSAVDWADQKKTEIKSLQRELQGARSGQIDIESMVNEARTFSSNGHEGKLILADIDMDDRAALSLISDKLRDKIQTGVVVVVGHGSETHPIIVSVSKNLTKTLNAGHILKELASEMGGKGGGRPDFAQGAGKDRSKLDAAFKKISESVTH